MLISLIYHVVVIVLLLTFSFGPSFFALLNTGIRHEYKTGSLLALGVVISDVTVCMLSLVLVKFGAYNLLEDDKTKRFMGIVAGIVLLIYGAFHYREPVPQANEASIVVSSPSVKEMLMKGFLLNGLNPGVWVLWLGNVTAVSNTLNYSVFNIAIFFLVTLALVFLVELAKLSAANRLKQWLTPRIMHIINIITGSLLIVFGAFLIYNFYFER